MPLSKPHRSPAALLLWQQVSSVQQAQTPEGLWIAPLDVYHDQRGLLARLFQLTGNMHVYREASPAHSLGKALEWDTPPRAKRDLRLHTDYLNSFDEPLPPPADSPAQASPLSIDSSEPPPLWWCIASLIVSPAL